MTTPEFIAGTTVLKVMHRDGLTQRLVRFKIGTKAQYDALAIHDPNILYFCQDTGNLYVGDTSYNTVAGIESLKPILTYVIDERTASDSKIPTVKAVMDYVINKIDNISGGLVYSGAIDANNPTANPKWKDAKLGSYFRVNVSGVIDGVSLKVGDSIIINKDVDGVPTAADMDVIAFTVEEIGDLSLLHTEAKENIVAAINEVSDNECRWNGL